MQEEIAKRLPLIESRLGYSFKDPDLLFQALMHRSFWNEHKELGKTHNERLEFLGDSVLGLVVAEYLYCELPACDEGELSRLRSQMVEGNMCSFFATKLDLAAFIFLGRGEQLTTGKGRDTILADAIEALIGAIYLDSNFDEVKRVFLSLFKEELQARLHEPGKNWKARLQDWAQKNRQAIPTYRVLDAVGPDHNKSFIVEAMIGTQVLGQGQGSSKKLAEQAAAEVALHKLHTQPTER